MNRILTAGAIASGLLAAAGPADARARHSHNALRQSTKIYQCDERGCIRSAITEESTRSNNALVMLAQSQIGNRAIYGRRSLWCGRFMNWALVHAGYRGTGSDLAKSFLKLPRTTPRVGAIAVFSRGGRFGHVGIVAGFDSDGNPIIISGNHGHRVGRGIYPRHRVIAYVWPVRDFRARRF
jgi:uncharacterized protein (TIGR02594 family)